MFPHPKKSKLYPKRDKASTLGKSKIELEDGVLFIDPGISGTGWAIFPVIRCSKKRNTKAIIKDFDSGSFTPNKSNSWQASCSELWSWFNSLLIAYRPKLIVIEFPEAWLSNEVSLASIRQGDIFKLMYLIGGFGSVIKNHNIPIPMLVLPREWKGQLPKKVMQERLKNIIGNITAMNEHELDAIGMGIAAQRGL